MSCIVPHVLVLAGLAFAASSPAGLAFAQTLPSADEARVHFDHAVTRFEAGDHQGALAEFQRAYDLSGRTSVLYNLGATYQALRDFPHAIEALRRYVDATVGRTTPERRQALRAIAQMEPLVARLQVLREPEHTTVLLDGRPLEHDRTLVAPGTHVLAASAAGFEPWRSEIVVAPREVQEVRIALVPVPPEPSLVAPASLPAATPTIAPSTPPAPLVSPPEHPSLRSVNVSPSRTPFWAMVATGGILAVGSVVTGALAINTQQDYATRRADDPQAPGLASRGRALSWSADLFGGGAIAAGIAAVWFGLRSSGRTTPTSAVIVVVPSVDGASATMSGTF